VSFRSYDGNCNENVTSELNKCFAIIPSLVALCKKGKAVQFRFLGTNGSCRKQDHCLIKLMSIE